MQTQKEEECKKLNYRKKGNDEKRQRKMLTKINKKQNVYRCHKHVLKDLAVSFFSCRSSCKENANNYFSDLRSEGRQDTIHKRLYNMKIDEQKNLFFNTIDRGINDQLIIYLYIVYKMKTFS